MRGGHDAEAGAADRALVLALLGAVLLVSPARLIWARGPLAVAAVFAVWVALIALAWLATRAGRGDGDRGDGDRGDRGDGDRADAARGDAGAARGEREPPP
ncbi:hypothetical protein [Sorangium sp. So ce341]|uniref:hypothetical protein n=1 Tax=Sorangium sp. So ce341 TaxID=3133302 RepID=UPI003F5E608C